MRVKKQLALASILICVFLSMLGCSKSSNQHMWVLPNNEKVEYYEGAGDSGFTANIPQYVTWISKTGGTNSLFVGNGGSYKSLALHLNQNQTVAWITGRYTGGDRQFYVAVLDLVNFKIVDGSCMWQSESHSSSSELKIKHEVEQSSAAATVVEEQKE
jgi:hypothetical protein